MRRRASRFDSGTLVLLLACGLACGGSDSFTPTEETVAGTYEAGSSLVRAD
jgi:hypothetical protein